MPLAYMAPVPALLANKAAVMSAGNQVRVQRSSMKLN